MIPERGERTLPVAPGIIDVSKRVRLSADEAKQRILEAAERQLIAGGPDSIRVQTLARELGITDAAIHYHFGSRDELMRALARFGGRRLRESVNEAIARWDSNEVQFNELIDLMLDSLDKKGHAWLIVWLALSGWRSRGSGMFGSLAEELETMRARLLGTDMLPEADRQHVRFLAAMILMMLIAEPLAGSAARRSVDLPKDAETDEAFRAWMARAFEKLLRDVGPTP